ncbi:MAG: transposase [Symploca sp. SIO2C1]|nr:transposase [Symploca sp. SIO2C1]
MLVLEYKVQAKQAQYRAIDEAIRTVQFIRNKCLRYWMDAPRQANLKRFDLNKYSTELRNEFTFVKDLNSMACQASAERTWIAINRFYDNCKSKKPGKKGYPRFQKDNRSVEYKTSGWKLHKSKRRLTITDNKGIGELKLLGKWDIHTYPVQAIKRVRCKRLVKKSLSTRTHVCQCGCTLHRDTNAAVNILLKAKSRGGHPRSNAKGVAASTLFGVTLVEQVATVNLESPRL